MTTVLTIVLAVLIVFNIWLAFWTAKLEKERRRKYQERLDECDERISEVMNEMGKTKQHLNTVNSANAALKRSFEETIAEYEKLLAEYNTLKQGKEPPVDTGQPSVHDTPGEAANKPLKPLRPKKTAKKVRK